MKKNKFTISILISTLLLGSLTILFANNLDELIEYGPSWKEFYTQYRQANKKGITTKGQIILGSKKPILTIIEFSDFMCPYCKTAGKRLGNFAKNNSRYVKLIYMPYPLDKTCNTSMRFQMHRGACMLALGAYCAQEKGIFKKYHDYVFSKQYEMKYGVERSHLEEILTHLKWDDKKFFQCVNSSRIKKKLNNSINEANRLGVQGTPTIYINGRKIKSLPKTSSLRKLIQKEALRR